MESFLENDDVKIALQKFLESTQLYLLVIGPSGSGKTTVCQHAFQQWGPHFQVMRPVYEEFQNHKDLVDHLEKFVKVRNMLEIFENKPKLLFLDDIDTLISQDRFANQYIQSLIDMLKGRGIKLLMTCTSGHEKKVADIKKKVLLARIVNPSTSSTCLYLRQRHGSALDSANISEEQLLNYVKSMNANIRSCELNIELLIHGSDDAIEGEGVSRIAFDKSICDVVASIFNAKHLPAKDLDICLSEDPTLISYIMYENCHKLLCAHEYKKPDIIKTQSQIISAYVVGSIMETSMYIKNDWFLHDVCNLYRCGIIKSLCGSLSPQVITYTTITTRASNYYNMVKRVGEHQAVCNTSFPAIQRYHEIETGKVAIRSQTFGRRHKEDSGINNYIKRIYDSKRNTERKVLAVRRPRDNESQRFGICT